MKEPGHVEGEQSLQLPPRLYERLAQLSGYTWDQTIQPFHSTYDDWHVFGYKHYTHEVSASSSLYGAGKPDSTPSSPKLGFRPSFKQYRTGSHDTSTHDFVSAIPDGEKIRILVVARISSHTLRVEREHHLLRSFIQTSDPDCSHTVHPLDLARLPGRQEDEQELIVSIFKAPGPNYIKSLVDLGPAWLGPAKVPNDCLTGTDETPSPQDQASIPTFLNFAIGACECLELLHHGLRIVHGELRADAFHFNYETGAVKLINFGSGPRSFQNGLTSSGWMTLSRELGVKHKLQYIAPEQTGRMPAEPNSRTDVYSLGVLFWTMLTGKPAFRGETPLDIVQAVLGRRIPLASSKRFDCPDAISKIIQRMTQKQIDDRYHSTSGVKHDLTEVQRLLGEGESEGLSKFEIGLKDVPSFFVLPTTIFGRENERDKIVEVIRRMVHRQGTQDMWKPGDQFQVSTSGASNLSERFDNGEAITRSSKTSSQGSTSPALRPSSSRKATGPSSRSNSEDLPNGAAPVIKPPLEVSNSRESVNTTTSYDSGFNDGLRPDYSSSGLQAGTSRVPRHVESYRKSSCELIAVTGAAGSGKSSLIQHTQAEIRKWGYFASAKFDPARKAPFEPLLRAVSSLFRQIFSESDISSDYHTMIRKSIRGMWGSVCNILDLPDYLMNTETQPTDRSMTHAPQSFNRSLKAEVMETGSLRSTQSGNGDFGPNNGTTEARTRTSNMPSKLSNVLIKILRILSHRLICICLDDVNYADEESLDLVSTILRKKLGIVILTTCRDEGALSYQVEHVMKNPSANTTFIKLAPLSEKQVVEFVAIALYRPPEYILPLAMVCLEKSNGNPFYLKQMLETCYRKGCLWYSWKEAVWEFDLDRVFGEFASDSYGEQLNTNFITKRLQDLPTAARAILAWASLLGTTFSFQLVQMLLSREFDYREDSEVYENGNGTEPAKILTSQPVEDVVEGLQSLLQAAILVPGSDEDEFSFSHDRYISASASLRECHDTEKMHYIITQVMMKYSDLDGRSLYARAQHICKASKVIPRRSKHRYRFRALLVDAALKAIESGARPTALGYYETCLALLQADPWDEEASDVYYLETLSIYAKAAELYWHQGQLAEAQNMLDSIFRGAHSALDKAPAWILQSKLFAQAGNFQGASTALKTSLLELGLDLSAAPAWETCDREYSRLSMKLQAAGFGDIIDKPLSSDNKTIATGAVLMEAVSAGFWSNSLLFYQCVQAMISMHLDQPATFPQAGLGFAYLAIIAIGRFADLPFGLQMHDVSRQLLKQSGDSYSLGRGLTLSAVFIAHLCAPMREQMDVLEEAIDHSILSGDKHTMLFSFGSVAINKLFIGDDMADIESYCSVAAEDWGDWSNDVRGGVLLTAVRQVSRSLGGKTWNDTSDTVMSDDEHDATVYIDSVTSRSTHPEIPKNIYNSLQLIPLYLYGHYEKASQLGAEIIASIDVLWSMRLIRLAYFYTSLSLLAAIRESPSNEEQGDRMTKVRQYQSLIVRWQAECDANYLMWSQLIEAGLAELEGRYEDAIQALEAACDHIELNELPLEQAIAFELQGEFLVRRGARRAARFTLLEAKASYSRIGASGKVSQLSAKYEWILRTSTTVQTVDQAVQTASTIGEIGNTQLRIEENEREETRQLGKETPGDRTQAWATTPDPVNNGAAHDVSDLRLDVLDLQSILEFNQAISSELEIDRLLATMTEIILESAGAQADLAAVVIEGDCGWCIAASGTADGISAESRPITEIENETQKQVLLYTLRFKEVVFVHDLAEDDRFLNRSGSVLSIPILQGKNLLGVLYMEGQSHSFTDRNLAVLQLFVNQVGISIANALLFKRIAKVSAANQSMIGQQKLALGKARAAELKAKVAEAEAMENVRLKEEAAKAKSMFLANVSHELRTPLNGVIGMSELLKDTPLSQEQAGFANNIKVCADTLLTVINDILDFSKLEAGKMKLFSVPLNLKETIAEVVRALQYTNLERGLETTTKLDLDPDLLVMGDPVRIHQIFMNLLSNSYKFTPKGSVTVRAKVKHESSDSVTVTCSVSDTGIGITQEQVSRLFKPFSQADSSTQRSYGGSGLGLSICKALVEAFDGTISMKSRIGAGTMVSFVIKFQKAATSATADSVEVSTKVPDPMATWSSDNDHAAARSSATSFFDLSTISREQLRICIAEDNPINQKIAVSFVKKLGIKSEAFSDGQQAVEALRCKSKENLPFHLVLMDVQMPVLDGYNATRVIRQDEDPAVRGVLIIAMTASAIQGDREKCLEAGMNNYLAKPVKAAVLKTMLEDYLRAPPKHIPDLQGTVTNLAKNAIAGVNDENMKTAVRPGLEKRMSSKIRVPFHGKDPQEDAADTPRPSKPRERPVATRTDSAVTVTQDDIAGGIDGEESVPPLSLSDDSKDGSKQVDHHS